MNEITKEWMTYYNDYLRLDDDYNDDAESYVLDIRENMGDYVCKYAETQEEVNDVLDEIDVEMEKIHEDWNNY